MHSDLALREWYLDSLFPEHRVNADRDFTPKTEMRILLGPEHQQKIQVTVSEALKNSEWLRIPEHFSMAGGNFDEDINDTLRVCAVRRSHRNVDAPSRFAERPVNHAIG